MATTDTAGFDASFSTMLRPMNPVAPQTTIRFFICAALVFMRKAAMAWPKRRGKIGQARGFRMDREVEEFYRGKSVLVTGGTGMIGRPLVEMLLAAGAKVRIASLDSASRAPAGAAFVRADLREFGNCLEVCRGIDTVFHLAGVKGS